MWSKVKLRRSPFLCKGISIKKKGTLPRLQYTLLFNLCFSAMDGSDGSAAPPPQPPPAAAADLKAAEQLILQWDPTASPCSDRMVFDGEDRAEAERYLQAVDVIRRALKNSPAGASGSPRKSGTAASTIQIAMVRLEDEFRHILVSRANAYEIDSIIDLNSLSLPRSSSGDLMPDLPEPEPEDEGLNLRRSVGSSNNLEGSNTPSYRSTSSIREIDLLPDDAAQDLRSIADRMIAAGYGRECFQVYGSVRKSALELCFRHLGIERLSIGDVQRLDWVALESKIRRWIRAARVCIRIIFASEQRLCDLIFAGSTGDEAPFVETVKGAAVQLLSFAEAISIGRRSPEKLFKILDLHDALSDLLPDVAVVFHSRALESLNTQVSDIITRLADAVRGILSEFESAVLREPSKIPVPGGTIHPLTRYVMNYISLISDYKQTLLQLIVSKPPAVQRLPGDEAGEALPEVDLPEPAKLSPLASHLIWIIVILQFNMESKAQLYKDAALSHLFLMNNFHYIVQKVKGSPELHEMIGDDFLKKLTAKFRQLATSYVRATWVKILYFLRDEGLHVGGSFSSSVSKSTLRERFKGFNAAFDEVHRTQSAWFVPESQLREELRISISEKLLPAYRFFLGRFRQHIESGRHPEMYIKYSAEDLELALSDFFEGCPPPLQGRRKSH
ncbi:exocyst complex component EXO70B1-like [Phalaenopsis equestris]|uniref:exocyst complex component EXO70B1-like n=1 Tax=Phalaenopsis equestris TaxID=78828 RepID=UPI0009E2C326|nr:exocyst complex component EXO70B1-like [Phalaenopsis equestris]